MAQVPTRGNDGRRVQQAGQEHGAVPRIGPGGRANAKKTSQRIMAILQEARMGVGPLRSRCRRVRNGPGGVAASVTAAAASGERASIVYRHRGITGLAHRPATKHREEQRRRPSSGEDDSSRVEARWMNVDPLFETSIGHLTDDESSAMQKQGDEERTDRGPVRASTWPWP